VVSGGRREAVNQFAGTRAGTLYPGVHWVLPFIEQVELYDFATGIHYASSMIRKRGTG